ncbi:MAG: retroviral-like aspartic protease family protein [Roseiarcus sp.]
MPEESVTWSGLCKDGVATGPGVVQWFKSGKISNRIEVNYRDGRESIGQVTVTYPTGEKYFGFLNEYTGLREGRGTLAYPNGLVFIGGWKDGQREGEGTFYAVNGRILQTGTWTNGALLKPTQAPSEVTAGVSPSPSSGHAEVGLLQDGGTFKVPVVINGTLSLSFIVDSGATDVNIPVDVMLTLMRTGTLRQEDFLGTNTYVLADGSSVPSQTFRIRSLKVGDRVIEDVTATMGNVKGDLLLGQSFLSRFTSWSINNRRQALVLEW